MGNLDFSEILDKDRPYPVSFEITQQTMIYLGTLIVVAILLNKYL